MASTLRVLQRILETDSATAGTFYMMDGLEK